MAWLAAAIGNIVAGIVAWFATQGAKKVALVSAGLAAIGTAFTALLNQLGDLLAQLGTDLLPPAIIEPGLSLLPSNTALCISLILASRALRLGMDWSMRAVDVATKAG